MKKLLLLSAFLVFACDNADDISPKPISTSINKIMCLGASRVEGARPDFESYRFDLWKELKDNNWTFG